MLGTILLVFAFVLSVIQAFREGWPPALPNLGWLALACYFLALILGGVAGLR